MVLWRIIWGGRVEDSGGVVLWRIIWGGGVEDSGGVVLWRIIFGHQQEVLWSQQHDAEHEKMRWTKAGTTLRPSTLRTIKVLLHPETPGHATPEDGPEARSAVPQTAPSPPLEAHLQLLQARPGCPLPGHDTKANDLLEMDEIRRVWGLYM